MRKFSVRRRIGNVTAEMVRRLYKGIVCDKCGVEVTRSVVRRERMGRYIKLAATGPHRFGFARRAVEDRFGVGLSRRKWRKWCTSSYCPRSMKKLGNRQSISSSENKSKQGDAKLERNDRRES